MALCGAWLACRGGELMAHSCSGSLRPEGTLLKLFSCLMQSLHPQPRGHLVTCRVGTRDLTAFGVTPSSVLGLSPYPCPHCLEPFQGCLLVPDFLFITIWDHCGSDKAPFMLYYLLSFWSVYKKNVVGALSGEYQQMKYLWKLLHNNKKMEIDA